MQTIRRVAVLGAGTMGSRIAAHFANAGIGAELLDMVLPGEADRSAAARRGIEGAATQRPVAFHSGAGRQLVRIGNFDDDLERIRDCDWVIEAVVEEIEAKRRLWSRVEPYLAPEAILSTNTSGISLRSIGESLAPENRTRFLGTHFFNPPRYLHLVELVPGPETSQEVLRAAEAFCDRRLGKGVVVCKDTPNFIGNRIGAFFGATVHSILVEDDYTIEEVDAITGTLIGLPKSASFRLLDIIGLDVWKAVIDNLRDTEAEQWKARFEPPGFLLEMIRRGLIGEKAGAGFYRRVQTEGGRAIEAIDWKTYEYSKAGKPSFPSVEAAADIDDLGDRLRYLVQVDDRAGRLVWRLLRDLFLYSAERVPEISDRIVEIDRAMRWGYAFQMGPFELWDALGFEETARRMESEGVGLPAKIRQMLSTGAKSFYRVADSDKEPCTEYFDFGVTRYSRIEERPEVVRLAEVKRARGVVNGNAGASLIDLGEGVLCVEFHSKMNTLGEDALGMIRLGLEEAERNFEGLLLANQGAHFSAGANLTMILLAAQEGDFDQIDVFLRQFQAINMAIRCAAKPVVVAPFGHTLGGGCEIALHAARVQASAELYMGLVEVGVGLIPAAGGTKQMLMRFGDADKAHELISKGRASTSATDAREMGLLTAADGVTMNPDRLIADAKRMTLSLAASYVPAMPREDVTVGGEAVAAKLKIGAWLAHEAERITDYDLVIAEKLAHVLAGGKLTGQQGVSEEYLLDLEREAFLSLCGNRKTQDRIAHMLRTGKPLRN